MSLGVKCRQVLPVLQTFCGAGIVYQVADGSNLPQTLLPEPHFTAKWQ